MAFEHRRPARAFGLALDSEIIVHHGTGEARPIAADWWQEENRGAPLESFGSEGGNHRSCSRMGKPALELGAATSSFSFRGNRRIELSRVRASAIINKKTGRII